MREECRGDLEEVFREKQIFVYGYGNVGRNAYQKIRAAFPRNKLQVVVSRLGKTEKCALKRGIPIIPWIEMMQVDCKDNVCVVLALNPLHHEKLQENLSCNGFHNNIIYDEEIDFKINQKIMKAGG